MDHQQQSTDRDSRHTADQTADRATEIGGPMAFALGPLHVSPDLDARYGIGLALLVRRHVSGDWGLDADDAADRALLDENMASITPTGQITGRVTSRHSVDGETVYVITEATGTTMVRADAFHRTG